MAVARYPCLTPSSGDGGGAPDPGGPEGKDLGLTPQVPVLVTLPLRVRIKYRVGVGLVPVAMSNVVIAPDVPFPNRPRIVMVATTRTLRYRCSPFTLPLGITLQRGLAAG